MIELPEARTIAKDLSNTILGKKIVEVGGIFTGHKFTFYYPDPLLFDSFLKNKKITGIIERNFYVEIEVEDYKITFRDGISIRYYEKGIINLEKSKFFLKFEDESILSCTTLMYGAISVFSKNEKIDDAYYLKELNGVGVLDPEFTFAYFKSLRTQETDKLSLKAFLATEQRILGIGNGVLQDILYDAKLHPKRKLFTLTNEEYENLFYSIQKVLKEMITKGGRDTEKNIYGEFGGYETKLSKRNYPKSCLNCGNLIKKENYLGGSIYFCENCQR